MVINLVKSGFTVKNGIVISKSLGKAIFLGCIIALITIIFVFKFIKKKFAKEDLFCNLTININNKNIKVISMVDTGNMLKEPISNIPVIVVEHSCFDGIIPKEILDNIDNILGGDFSGISKDIQNEYIPKLKLIPFTSLGKQNGMLLGLKPKSLKIEYLEEVKNVEKVIIGLYNKKLSKNSEYKALIGANII